MMTKIPVYAVRVLSRNFVDDFGAELKNIIGGRLKTYEVMLSEGIKECLGELHEKHGDNLSEVKIEISQLTNGSLALIVYGIVGVADAQ
jgi:uncharacterized protein YbjQ (UPF0145 family)